jgi:hypothetical protein
MKVQIDENDVVVLVTAYGQKVVRVDTQHGDEVYVTMIRSEDGVSDEVLWRGNLDGCMRALTEDLSVLMAQEPVWRQPDEILVKDGREQEHATAV